MRLTSWRIVGALVAVSLGTAGCGSTIDGQATAAAGGGRTGSATGTASSSESSGSPSTASPRTTLQCPGVVVSPDGAPYCYTSPDGLDSIDLGGVDAGEEGVYRTSFGTGALDYVDVQVYELTGDTDSLSSDDIVGELAGVISTLEDGGFTFDANPATLTIDGARGFRYAGASTDGSQQIVAHFVFRGVTEVQVNCSSTTDSAAIDPGCQGVLDSLQLIG